MATTVGVVGVGWRGRGRGANFITQSGAWGVGRGGKKAISRGGVRVVLPVKEDELWA